MALDTEVGGSTSDSYASLAYANSFFLNHYSTVKAALWATLTTPRKESVLRRACQQIETLKVLDNEYSSGRLPAALVIDYGYDLSIHRAAQGQRLQFPRNLDIDSSDELFVPQEVTDAQCEQAVHLLAFDDANIMARAQGIVEEAATVGPIKSYVKYSDAGAAASYLSPMAIELMRPFLITSGRLRRS